MKLLGVLRHAKSSWDQPGLQDFNRPLNERGWKAARRIGREMKRRRLDFDLVLASEAARVRETIDGIQEQFDFDAEIRFDPAIYMADETSLMKLVQSLPDAIEAPLLVGHNPGLERLLLKLAHDDMKRLRKKVADGFPTAALALMELPSDHWKDVAPASGEIVDLILPKELD